MPNAWVSIAGGETASAEEIYQKLISGKIKSDATVMEADGSLPVVDYFHSLQWIEEDPSFERRRVPIIEAIAKKEVQTAIAAVDKSGNIKLSDNGRLAFVDEANNVTPISKESFSALLRGAGKDASRLLLNLGPKVALFDNHLFRGKALNDTVTRKPQWVMNTPGLLHQLHLPLVRKPEQRPYSERATEAWSVILREAITHPNRQRGQPREGLRLIQEAVLSSQTPIDVDRFVTHIIESANRLSLKRATLFFLSTVAGLSLVEAFRLGPGFTRHMNHEVLIEEALQRSLAEAPRNESSLVLPFDKEASQLESWLKRYVAKESRDPRFVRDPFEALALFHDLILRSPQGEVVTTLSGVDLGRYLPSLQGAPRKALQLLFELMGGKGTLEVLDKNQKQVLPPFTIDEFARFGFPQEAAFSARQRRYSKVASSRALRELNAAIHESRKFSRPQSSYNQDRALLRQARKDAFIREWNQGAALEDLGASEGIPVAIIRGWIVEKYGVEPDAVARQ
jgi:hypothetical protein